ncbi:MAG TPA: energy transducer TonB [Sphaerochaeta sp.]|nr:energy transducer TonB [Sphaerochaeta sp.]
MNILRTTLLTILVTAASLVALLIPLNSAEPIERAPRATGATISLVDSLPSAESSKPSVPKRPEGTTVEAEPAKNHVSALSVEEKPLPSSDDGIVPMVDRIESVAEYNPEPLNSPILENATEQEKPASDSSYPPDSSVLEPSLPEDSSSEASVAVSAVSLDPIPSLVDGYYETTSVDQGPVFDRAILASRIKYPSLAKRQGIEGLVILRVFISSSGKIERIEVEEDPGYGLAQAAVKAFTGLQGKPAILEGKAVPVTLRYPVRFTLK